MPELRTVADKKTAVGAFTVACVFALATPSHASEHLGNNQRTGYTEATVPRGPVLLWTYKERHAPKAAWPDHPGELAFIDFDYSDQTTLGDGLVFFGSSADHTVRALDAGNGEERWAFYTEGPVRFAPVLYKDSLYAASDDGHIYRLKASGGSLLSKVRLAPGSERCLGNGQMISKWPCRSGVLIDGDRLYTTAGMWSHEGVFIYCLNADSGEIIWKNEATGFRWMYLPHGSGYGGVAPQGYLALYKNTLYVAAGRAAPAILDAATGQLLFHEIGRGYKPHYPGGSWLMAAHDWVMFKRQHNHKDADVQFGEYRIGRNAEGIIMYHYRTGNPEMALTGGKVLGAVLGDDMILAGEGPVIRVNVKKLRKAYSKVGVATTRLKPIPPYMDPSPLAEWTAEIGRVYSLLIAGDAVIAGGRGVVTLLDAGSGKQLWQRSVKGQVRGISAANGKFIATTTSGHIYCFGEGAADLEDVVSHKPVAPLTPAAALDSASRVLRDIGIEEGYCLMLGAGDGSLLFELLKKTQLVVYCLEPDSAKRHQVRALLDRAGWLGTRAQLHSGFFDNITYAPYAANCIIWGRRLGSPSAATDFKGLYRSLRPWGGVACEFGDGQAASASRKKLIDGGVPEGEISQGSLGTLVRRGPLPGAGEWTRPCANTGNTFSTKDDIVKPPLGILWWGGVGPEKIVSRHWRAPVPLFSKGHLFVQGQHDIIGVDAYTGREMWIRHIEGVGRFPSGVRGGNIITDGERVYCVKGLTCYALDAKTGRTVHEYMYDPSPQQRAEMEKFFPLYRTPIGKKRLVPARNPVVLWEFLGMAGGRILGTLGVGSRRPTGVGVPFPSMSRCIFALDKETGEKVWEITLDRTVSPNAIVSDDTRLYFIDRTDEPAYEKLRRRGLKGFGSALKAVRLSDGKPVWARHELQPQRKALLLSQGILVASANFQEDAVDMNSGLSAFRAADGAPLWNLDNPGKVSKLRRGGPVRKVFIVGDTIYTPFAIDLKTGKEKLVSEDPLTGAPARFQLSGQNFCGNVAASRHILVYRSTSIGFRSLSENTPCYWLPETRSSCWISVLPAGGMLLSPEGSSTCVCSFNYKTSLAMIPVERHEKWGVYLRGSELPQGCGVRRRTGAREPPANPAPFHTLNLNLNAPGDRLDTAGNGPFFAWPQPLYPTKKCPMVRLPVEGAGRPAGFRFSSDFTPVAGTERPWIYSCGLTGEIELSVLGMEPQTYRAVLHFLEPEPLRKGARVFDVLINGKKVLDRVDIVREAGAPHTALVKELKGIGPCTTLKFSLKHVSGKPPLLCGIELTAQGAAPPRHP